MLIRSFVGVALAAAAFASACTGASISPTTPVVATATATAASTVVAVPTATGQVAAPGGFALDVTSPVNESVVRVSPVEVRGTSMVDAVVTVNGLVQKVDSAGKFSVMVTLTEGPNTIEVVASDFRDNQASKVLTVVYVR